ncbi:Gfo/Idh/MocA family oxidoreductase [Arcticibacterium luteifluviistationis]|uniref:Oxidoreductase n=1 Tax=Arcticibacterium luteifluviistationis TaxID=1784714 RepID=A0A2Z4G6Y7_9BACT|nr:Gfo/Idh/MocA family oxidoreductase [Arcticibacterium luteifluviistationis]AWV96922.1 oxidoreductase [Arcticibacterium luteifluviistationis]
MIKVGLVGFGLSGRWLQAPFFVLNPNFHLKYIVTSQNIGQELFKGTEKAADLDQLIADPEIDLISICSPSSTHFDYCKRALNAGKHVLVEKPMTATYEEAQELVALCKKVNKTLMIYQNRRFDGDFMTVKRVIESGVLGEILSYEARWHRYNPILNKKPWKEAVTPANGIIYDLGAHLIDQAIYLFGNPEGVAGDVFIQRENSNIDDAFNMSMNYGKVKVKLSASLMVKEAEPRYVVHGTNGSFIKHGLDPQEDHLKAGMLPGINPDFGFEAIEYNGQLTANLAGMEMKGEIDTFGGDWMQLYDNLADVILNGAEAIIKPEEIAEQIRVIEEVKKN